MPHKHLSEFWDSVVYGATAAGGLAALNVESLQAFLNDWLTTGIGLCSLIVVGHKAIGILKGKRNDRKRNDLPDL